MQEMLNSLVSAAVADPKEPIKARIRTCRGERGQNYSCLEGQEKTKNLTGLETKFFLGGKS